LILEFIILLEAFIKDYSLLSLVYFEDSSLSVFDTLMVWDRFLVFATFLWTFLTLYLVEGRDISGI